MGFAFKKPIRSYLLFEYRDKGYILDFEFSVTSHSTIGERFDFLTELIENLYKEGFTPSDFIQKYDYIDTYCIEQEWSYVQCSNHKDLYYARGINLGDSKLWIVVTNIAISDFGQMKYRTGGSEWTVYLKYLFKGNKFKRRKTMFLIN